jgi:hypothetical protein
VVELQNLRAFPGLPVRNDHRATRRQVEAAEEAEPPGLAVRLGARPPGPPGLPGGVEGDDARVKAGRGQDLAVPHSPDGVPASLSGRLQRHRPDDTPVPRHLRGPGRVGEVQNDVAVGAHPRQPHPPPTLGEIPLTDDLPAAVQLVKADAFRGVGAEQRLAVGKPPGTLGPPEPGDRPARLAGGHVVLGAPETVAHQDAPLAHELQRAGAARRQLRGPAAVGVALVHVAQEALARPDLHAQEPVPHRPSPRRRLRQHAQKEPQKPCPVAFHSVLLQSSPYPPSVMS